MTVLINASNTSGLTITSDTSGNVAFQSNGANVISFDTTQRTTLANSATATAFIPSGSTVPTNGMYLSATNNVSFATNSTEVFKLDSVGIAYFLGTTNTGGGSAVFTIDSNLYNGVQFVNTRAQGATYTRFYTTTTRTGSITTSDQTTTLYNTTSDYRLKTNVTPMVGAVDKLMQVKPVNYTWIETGTPANGFIAHELQAVFPEAVSGEKDAVDENGEIDPQGVDASKLVPALVAAIQELKAEIDALKAKVGS